MVTRPKLLDLFCCQGGAARGYARAGFDVLGLDIDRQPRYPFAFCQGDALDVLRRLLVGESINFVHPDRTIESLPLSDFAAIHASPPCQGYSIATLGAPDARARWPRLIAPVRELLMQTAVPYIIENVTGAREDMHEPFILCGSMFGLSAVDDDGTALRMERHRWFEASFPLGILPGFHVHDRRISVGGAYGGGRSDRTEARVIRRGGYTPSKAVRERLLGIEPGAMTLQGLSECIPPAYTEWIGQQLIAHLAESAT